MSATREDQGRWGDPCIIIKGQRYYKDGGRWMVECNADMEVDEYHAATLDELDAMWVERDALQAKLDAIDALLADSSEREPTLGHYDDGWHDALYAVYLALHPEGDTPT